MRYRLMATYRGVPYEAGEGPSGADVVLFAACPPPEELGFEPATGHWRKQVIRAEVDALWESRPVGTFRGEPCMVLDDLGDRLHIAYLGTDAGTAARLGYWQVDRGVFELLTPRDEVTGLTEERVDRPLLLAPPVGGAGPGPRYPYRPAPSFPDADGLATGPQPRFATGPQPRLDTGPQSRLDTGPQSGLPGGLEPAARTGSGPGLAARGGRGFAAGPGPGPGTGSGSASPAGTRPGNSSAAWRQPARDAADWWPAGQGGGRASRRSRVATRDVFCELADLAAIPRAAYALEAEVDGALCLLPTASGFEVFVAVGGARHEVRVFPDEEAAYFYLFGVLAAEAIRNGDLAPASSPAGGPPRL